MRLALEFIGPAKQLNSIQVASEVVDQSGAKNGGLGIDSYHFFAGPSTFQDLGALPLSRIISVHLADGPADLSDPSIDFNRRMPGEGELPLKEFVQVIDAKGFSGFWHLECIQPEDYAADLATVAGRGFQMTQKLLNAALSESGRKASAR
jgi:4-hydroxyphenylpyruvate dioxygenase